MRQVDGCPHRAVLRGEGPGEVAHCRLVEQVAVARLASVRVRPRRLRPPSPDGRVRVGFVSPCGYLGGAERWHATLIPRLDRGRFDVVGVGILYDDQTHPILLDELVGICPVRIGAEAVRELAARVDVLVVWGIAEPGPYLPEWEARPTVVMVMHVDGRNPDARAMATRASPDVDHFACVAPAALEAIPEARRAGAVVIPNGVDPERVRPTRPREAVRREWGIAPGRRVLGFLGRISPEKHPEALAEAIAALHRMGWTEWVGVAVGDGYDASYAASVRDRAARLAGGGVVFTGGRTDVANCLAAFDALLIPSHTEGCCITLIEGWMARVAVLATRVGLAASHPELVIGLDLPCGGSEIASALILALDARAEETAARVACAVAFANQELSAPRFAVRWGDYVNGLATAALRPLASESEDEGTEETVVPARLCEVRRDACTACCAGDAPTVSAINSVIASHVFLVSRALIEQAEARGRDVRPAVALKEWAIPRLRQVPVGRNGPLARGTNEGTCFHLGDQSGLRDCPTCRGTVRIKVFACRHLLHDETTIAECRGCPDFDGPLRKGGVASWAVGVTTAPRRVATLRRCLASLAAAGWSAPRLFAEPGVEVPDGFTRVTVTHRDRRIGEWPNWYLGLAELVHRYPLADAYMMVQDDTVFSKGVRGFLEAELWPERRLGLVSVYCPEPYARASGGWNRVWSERGMVGALTFIFPNAAARALLSHPTIINHRRKGMHRGLVDTDGLVGRWAWQAALPVYYLSPSLAQHIGDTSTVWPGAPNAGIRRSANFAGEEFDARVLLAESPSR